VRLDGPALRVSQPNCSDRWFPLRVLSRVLADEQTDWTLEALLACARAGICVSFQDGDARLVARVCGPPSERQELAQRLADLLVRPDWPALYADWRSGMDRMAARSVARRACLPDYRSVTAPEMRQLLDKAAHDLLAAPAWHVLGGELIGQLLRFAADGLHRRGVDLDTVAMPGFQPARDFAEILFWDFQLARLYWVQTRVEWHAACALPTRAEAVALLERRRERCEFLRESLINRFRRWLVALQT
jgi:hypothetical protein